MSTPYSQQIKAIAPSYDPRHIEAYMRSEHSTLDALSPLRFRSEVQMACACVDQGGTVMAERLAKSYGW
jgi:hypothetical protein